MNTIKVKFTDYKPKAPPQASDATRAVVGECDVVFKGRLVCCVRRYNGPALSDLHTAAAKVAYPKNAKRTNGLPVKNRSFGFTTRNVIRGDYCSAASLARDNEQSHRVLCNFSEQIAELYKSAAPTLFEKHEHLAAVRVSQDWKLGSQFVFTSGNANRNNPINYHYDTGNFKDVWSAMIVLRRGATGGWLVLPEYDVAIYLDDGDCLFFDGQSVLHGVTPIELAGESSYRISLVYYTLDQMWKCLDGGKELERIRREKTDRERAIVGKRGYRGGKPEFRKRRDLPSV